jgi:hypothetical protein
MGTMCGVLAPRFCVTALVALDMVLLLYQQTVALDMVLLLYQQTVGRFLGCHVKDRYSKILFLQLF